MTENHPRIMVVDDKQGMVTTMVGILEDEGYDVIGVNDGYQAIALAKESPFALIFMDVVMPGINGVETFREIKKISPDTVVVMMTGFSVEEQVKDALEEGAHAVIYKPFEVGQILDIVQSVLKTTFVLVVDDRAADRETLGAVLEDSGYAVSMAEDGRTAIAMAAARHYGVILMDIRMPGMDGITTFEEIRKIDPTAKAIFISSYAMEGSMKEALLRDAYAVLGKPLDPEKLLTLVKSVAGWCSDE